MPQSLNASWTGTKGVNAYSKTCVGYGVSNPKRREKAAYVERRSADTHVQGDQIGYEVSEDCLYMNVVRPAGIAANAKLPVAFWIHGGSSFLEYGFRINL